MDFQSHTHNMHNNWVCPGGNQGGQFLCEDTDKAVKDLKISQERLGGAEYLAYPYFDFNEHTFKVLKKAGFKLAFIGQYDSDGYSDKNTHKYMIRRKTIFSDDPLKTFISYLK